MNKTAHRALVDVCLHTRVRRHDALHRVPTLLAVCAGMMLSAFTASRCDAQEGDRLPALRIEDGRIVDAQGAPVALRGCNLGNWLVLELWMLDRAGQGIEDQFDLEANFRDRFGEAGRARLMELYRAHWITEADFERIRSFGMNLVRLPFEYGLLEDDAHPMQLKPDAWRWLDRAVGWAEKHGLYVILDLHGAPGRQSDMDHTGRRDHNRLWSDPDDQARTVWLWKEIAGRYRGRNAVVGYDLLNEPWGGTHADLRGMVDRLYEAIREVDEETIVILPGHRDGIGLYGDPRERGWTQYMFTMHWYPGFFGWGRPTPHVHREFLNGGIPEWGERMRALGVPLLVGEFNVVLKAAGGGEMMRRYFDAYAEQGWLATMWSYKVLNRSGGIGAGTWGMVTNAEPLPPVDLEQASLETIENTFRSYATMAMTVDEDLRYWLTTEASPSPLDDLPPLPPPLKEAPARDPLPAAWRAVDVGDARAGGQSVPAPGELVIYGGGDDIWARVDAFRFAGQPVTGDVTIVTRVVDLRDTHPHAKAGVMIRAGFEPGAPHAMLNVFPSGGLEFSHRPDVGQPMQAEPAGESRFPDVYLKLVRTGDRIAAYASDRPDAWRPCGTVRLPDLGDTAWVGLATLSHDNETLTRATYRQTRILPAHPDPGHPAPSP